MSNRLERLISRVRRIRLSRKEIAERSGLDETTVGRVLNGRVSPLLSTLEKIELVLDQEEAALAAQLGGDAA